MQIKEYVVNSYVLILVNYNLYVVKDQTKGDRFGEFKGFELQSPNIWRAQFENRNVLFYDVIRHTPIPLVFRKIKTT